MSLRLAPLSNGAPRSPGFARAFGRATIFGYQRGTTLPLAQATVTAYVPGSDTPWPDALYADESDISPVAFPIRSDDSGAVALWADAPGRIELSCAATGYLPQRVVLDLEPPPGSGGTGAVSSVNGRVGDVVLVAADVGALTQTQADGRYPLKTDSDPYPQYLTAGEVPATDVTVTTDASLTATESPANTFALAARLSPDSGNALALRGNGLYSTDTTGAGGAYVDEAGDTMTGALRLDGASNTTNVLNARVAGDANARFRIDALGKLEWSTASGTLLASLFGSAAQTLRAAADLIPDATTTYRLGTTTLYWNRSYVQEYNSSDTGFLQVGQTNPAAAGAVRLRNAATVAWRNAGSTANLSLAMDASDRLALAVGAGTLTATATAGTSGAAPSQVATYLTVVLNGTAYKIPAYLP